VVANLAPKCIGLLGFENVTASHLAGPADAFAAAALDDGYGGRIPCYEVWTIGLTAAPFKAESGTIFKPQKTLRTAPEFDTIIIPGGSGLRQPEVNRAVSEWIRSRAEQTRRIASVCTGIYGLAPTGLLDGRDVTTHWRFARDVAERFPKLRVDHKKQLIRDGSFYTSAGLTAGLDLSLMLIEEDYGRQVASSLGRELVMYLAQRNVEEQPIEPLYFQNQSMDRFAQLVAWIVRNLDEDLSVDALARRACMCPRGFSRAFKSVFGSLPGTFVENLRLNEARRRLSTNRKTLQSVAESVGFRDTGTFRRAFERRFGVRASALQTVHGRPNERIAKV
jgi:transcriptional regulator GlxA family with amidase domain